MDDGMFDANRDDAFKKIKAYFDSADRERAKRGKLPLGSTEKGFWGVAHLDDVYELFKKINLQNKKSFLDLGSGDGRIVLVASLFTKATGIEFDEELHRLAVQAIADLNELGIRPEFIRSDYTLHNLSEEKTLFCYADHNFKWLENKRNELSDEHELYLYHDTYHPDFLHKGKIIWIQQIPVFTYRTNEPEELEE